jgi:YVTN family beta-propeller protein
MILASCKKDGSKIVNKGSVIIVNEGGFQHGDASISLYDPSTKMVTNNVFKSENNFSLGDVAQSLCMIGDTAFIVMNNSQNIVVADASKNFKYLRSITMTGASPRFFLPISGSKAYVTDLYANKIWVINYHTGAVTGNIPVSGWTEQLIASGGKVYVAEKTAPTGAAVHKLLMIDPSTDQVTGSIDLATDPASMALSDQNKLFVLTTQQSTPSVNASIYIVNLSSFSVEHKLDFGSSHTPSCLRYSSFTHQILYADNGISAMAQTDTILPASTFIPSNNWNIYGLNADPFNGDLYISDALDYQQASRIMRYSSAGTLIDAFNTGIITNGFIFR